MNRVLTHQTLEEIIRLSRIDKWSSRKIARHLGIRSKSTINSFLAKETYPDFWESYESNPIGGQTEKPEARRGRLHGSAFIFLCAQNNTFVHKRALMSLEVMAKHRGAQIIAGATYYNRNSGSQTNNKEREDVWFDPLIRPYLKEASMRVCDDLIWEGHMNILPTAVDPLSGLDSYTKGDSGVFPHPKIRMKPLLRHSDELPRFLFTTGAITLPNYIPQKAGQKAEFHHVIGALYVEVDENGVSYPRQIHIEKSTGNFYDLDEYFTPDGVEHHKHRAVASINWGDLHFEVSDPEVTEASFNISVNPETGGFRTGHREDNMLDYFRPQYQFFNDTADFVIRNHHNVRDPHFRFKAFHTGKDCVKTSLHHVAKGLEALCRDSTQTVVVESNHDQALTKWLKNEDYKSDPVNAVFFLDRQLAYYKALERGDIGYHIFGDAMHSLNQNLTNLKITFLHEGQSYEVCGIENGFHGHKGGNGARGSAQNFSKIGKKVNKGHGHSAIIIDGVYEAGTCSYIPLPYSEGSPTSWSHSHIVTYANGKRAIYTIKNGKWKA